MLTLLVSLLIAVVLLMAFVTVILNLLSMSPREICRASRGLTRTAQAIDGCRIEGRVDRAQLCRVLGQDSPSSPFTCPDGIACGTLA
jgi:hypothetical protein